jgi:3-oxoacyl-[acyl-carrier-protein] synthase III
MGVLNACHVATELIKTGQHHTALIAASEVAGYLEDGAHGSLDVEEAVSVLVLKRSEVGGFRGFFFKDFTHHQDACQVSLKLEPGTPRMHVDRCEDLDELYLDAICQAIPEFLDRENLNLSDLNVIFPPQFSKPFIARLNERLQLPKGVCVDVAHLSKDLFTSSLAYGLKYAFESNMIHPGNFGLIISVGSGIQVGCAVYEF